MLDDQVGIAVFEAVFDTAMIIGLLVLFRERFARGWPSFLTANAFAVYVLHAIVITALGIALSGLVAPDRQGAGARCARAAALLDVRRGRARALPGVKKVL
jgi:hypothetical protein